MIPNDRRIPVFEACNALFVAAWLAALVGSGLGAGVVFPVMKSLAPTLPEFAAYHGDHWRIAGGQVGTKLFWIADWIQLIALVGVIATLAPAIILRARTPARGPVLAGMRSLLVLLATALACYHIFVLAPRMMQTIQDFWAAARAGDEARAGQLQALFDADHPMSRMILESNAVLVVLMLLVGVYHAARGAVVKPGA